MAIHDLSAMTWEEVAALDPARVILILPVGATEAHGPHLPIATDVVISEAMARAAAALLSETGWSAVILPSIAYSPAEFAAGFAGTIGISHATMAAQVREIAASAGRHGFRILAIANSHLDPANTSALHAAAAEPGGRDGPGGSGAGAAGATIVYPDITRRPWGGRLSEEFRSGAAHAGRYESSIILAERPDLVRDRERAVLPAVAASLSAAIKAGVTTFEEAGGPRAYFGDPAAATADEGRRMIGILGGILAEAVLTTIESTGGAK